MSGSLLLILVSLILLLLIGYLIFFSGYNSRIYRLFGGVLTLILFIIAFLALDSSYYSEPVEIKVTNYSKVSGYIYFFEGNGCSAALKYGYAINANEESWLDVGENATNLGVIILLSNNDKILKVPAPDYGSGKLDIWEKELQEAEACFREQIGDYRREQAYFSLAIGLILFGLLFLFIFRRKRKVRGPQKIVS